jgi:hypothetical protein
MATYKQIQNDIRSKHGKTVQTCWIANVNELSGLQMHLAPNRHSIEKRVKPCPDCMRPLIEDSMRRFGII